MKVPSQPDAQKAMTTRVAVELPRTLELGEILGFMAGDGTISRERGRFGFANAEIFCISRMLANFKAVFGIENDRFHYYVTIPFEADEKALSCRWREGMGLGGDIIIYRDKRKRIRKKDGIMCVWLSDAALTKRIYSEYCDFLDGKADREVAIGFLRGFFAAEGAVIPGKKRKEVPNSIQFPQKGKRIPNVLHGYLDRLGIRSRVVLKQRKANYYCVNITGFENFKKFTDLGLADMHPTKKEKILHGLASYKIRLSPRGTVALEVLHFIAKNSPTRPEIYDAIDKTKQHVNGLLYDKKSFLVRMGFIEKRIGDNRIYWKVSEKGLEYLKKHNVELPP